MNYIIGIDEAGRGPLAGPVAVGVVLIPKNFRPKTRLTKITLKDSKQLTERAREAWFSYLKAHPKIIYTVSMVHPKTIDRINIAKATNLAATRALERLISNFSAEGGPASGGQFPISKTQIYLDAGIKINAKKFPRSLILGLRSLVRGDERITAIKLASIAAKVTRDRYITRKHKEYPAYRLNIHKGYGTKIHLQAIKTYGPCPIHRLTFIKKYTTI